MARPVRIEVEASLGDSLVKLGLAKTAIEDLKRSAGSAGSSLSGGTNSLERKLGIVGRALYDVRKITTAATRGFGDFLSAVGQGDGVLASFGQSLSGLAPVLGIVAEAVAGIGIALAALPLIISLVVSAVQTMVAMFGALVAIVADLAGPLLLVSAMLGGLGLGFILAGKTALGGGKQFAYLASQVSILKGEFAHLLRNLAVDFMPVFIDLVKAAQTALMYFMQLSHMPLDQAFSSLATKGMQLFQKFLEGVGHMLATPFRLAIKAAFSPMAAGADGMLGGDLSQLKKFLFGGEAASQGVKMNIPISTSLSPQKVQGALQPFLNWFNRHDFTAQGAKIGAQILSGLGRALGAIVKSGAILFLKNFNAEFKKLTGINLGPLESAIGVLIGLLAKAWPYGVKLNQILGKIAGVGFGALATAISTVVGLMEQLAGAAQTAYNWITKALAGGGSASTAANVISSRGTTARGVYHHHAAGGALDYGMSTVGELGRETVVNTPSGAYVLPGRPGQRGRGHHGSMTLIVNFNSQWPHNAHQRRAAMNDLSRALGVAGARMA